MCGNIDKMDQATELSEKLEAAINHEQIDLAAELIQKMSQANLDVEFYFEDVNKPYDDNEARRILIERGASPDVALQIAEASTSIADALERYDQQLSNQ